KKKQLILKRIKNELTTEEINDCYQKGYYKKKSFLHKDNPMYVAIKLQFDSNDQNIGTTNAVFSETLSREIDKCVDISGVDNLSFECNMSLNDAYEDSRNKVDYFTAYEIALMNIEDPYGDYDRDFVELDSSMAHATETSNRISTDGMVTTSINEAFLDSGASVNLIDKPSMLRDRKIVSDNEAMMLYHQGKWHRSRVVGNVVINNINGKEIVIRNVWVFPDLPNLTLAVNCLRADPLSPFEFFMNNKSTYIAVKQSKEDLTNGKPQIVFNTRQDPKTKLEYLMFDNYELRAPNWDLKKESPVKFDKIGNVGTVNHISSYLNEKTLNIKSHVESVHKIGHVNFGEILEGIRIGAFKYEQLTPNSIKGLKASDFNCEECDRAKIINASFRTSVHKVDSIGGCIHMDLHGPVNISRNGYRYFAIFVDEYTGYVWTIPLRHKSDATKATIVLLNLISNQFSQVKAIRTDHGTEFFDLHKFCIDQGIDHQASVEYAHQQNGRAERMIRHITTLCRALILESSAPAELWREALRLATHTTNMQYIRHVGGEKKTAFELLYGRVPNLSRFHPFGVDCIAFIPIEKQGKVVTENHGKEYGKFAPHGHRAIYLGEAPIFTGNTDTFWSQQGSIVYDIETYKIIIALKIIVYNHTYQNLKKYKKIQIDKDHVIPGSVFDVLTLNDFVNHPSQIITDEYTTNTTADNQNVTTEQETTTTSDAVDITTIDDSSKRITRSQTNKGTSANYVYDSENEEEDDNKKIAISNAQEESTDSNLVHHQEEDLEIDNSPNEWKNKDMDMVNDYMNNSPTVSGSYIDNEEKALKRKSLGSGRSEIVKRFKKDLIIGNQRFGFGMIKEGDKIHATVNTIVIDDMKIRASEVKIPNTYFDVLKNKHADFWKEAME
ncbi:MAG: DDE-type integrase/transposase/recombinase, partial [Staphylococcus equorum]|nr:DDE-type integrase/transposase/recombinase [Staphylococcus equorum]